MSMLTNEQRAELAARLDHPYLGDVCLLCDGRHITLQVQRAKPLTYRVMMFIDGELKGAWFSARTPQPEHKYLRRAVRPMMTAAERQAMVKAVGKREASKLPAMSATYEYYLADWANGAAAIAHLCRGCESVEEAQPWSEHKSRAGECGEAA